MLTSRVHTRPALVLLGLAATAATAFERPLHFVENAGQWPAPTAFAAWRGGAMARLDRESIAVELKEPGGDCARGVLVRLVFEGAAGGIEPGGVAESETLYHFLRGPDRSRWRPGVRAFAGVRYADLYPAIGLVVRGAETAAGSAGAWLEYDLHLAPGADLAAVVVRCDGADGIDLAADGALVIRTAIGEIRQPPPRTWHELPGGAREPVACRYRLLDGRRFGFEAPDADTHLPLVIDPVLEWAAALGGAGEERPFDLAEDAQGNIVVAGWTDSLDFATDPGAYSRDPLGARDGFLLRLDPATQQILSATYFGGSGNDIPVALAVDGAGGVVLAGCTASVDFPVTDGPAFGGGSAAIDWPEALDAFVARLAADGSDLDFASYVGGSGNEWAGAVALDGQGRIVISGYTSSYDLPASETAFQPAHGGGTSDLFIARLDPEQGGEVDHLTYLGGSGAEIPQGFQLFGETRPLDYENPYLTWGTLALAGDGQVVVSGGTRSSNFPRSPGAFGSGTPGDGNREVFVTRLKLDGSLPPEEQLTYSTVLATGSDNEGGGDVALAADGTIWVSGWSFSADFPVKGSTLPTTAGNGERSFVAHLDPTRVGAEQLLAAAPLGGDGQSYSLSIDAAGRVLLGGVTYASGTFPTTATALATTHRGGRTDGYFAVLDGASPALRLVYSTHVGGAGDDEVIRVRPTASGLVLILGRSSSTTIAGLGETHSNGDAQGFIALLDVRPPAASFTVTGPDAGGLVKFDGSGSSTPAGTEPLDFAWSFGDQATGRGEQTENRYEPGHYTARLMITNALGLTAEASRELNVPCEPGDVRPWTVVDLGTPELAGGARLLDGPDGACMELCAGGDGIVGVADEALFLYREVAGDFVLTARLAELDGARTSSQHGLMVRASLAAGAQQASLLVRGSAQSLVAGMVRAGEGEAAASVDVAGTGPWLRLERRGASLLASRSEDGVEWTRTEAPLLDGLATPGLLVGLTAALRPSTVQQSYLPLQARYCDVTLDGAGLERSFVRADADLSGQVEITDAILTLGFLFLGGAEPRCLAAVDADGNDTVEITDAIYSLSYLFLGGPSPPAPFPECGPDPTPTASACAVQSACPPAP